MVIDLKNAIKIMKITTTTPKTTTKNKKKWNRKKHSPDWLPPAIWRISFVNPFEPNWHDRSCKVRGSPRSINRSRKKSNVKLRAVSYSMVSMMPSSESQLWFRRSAKSIQFNKQTNRFVVYCLSFGRWSLVEWINFRFLLRQLCTKKNTRVDRSDKNRTQTHHNNNNLITWFRC